jgi:hypothetical protein
MGMLGFSGTGEEYCGCYVLEVLHLGGFDATGLSGEARRCYEPCCD